MARYVDPKLKQLEQWEAWKARQQPAVQAMAARFDPWSVYRLKTTGQRGVIAALEENDDGTWTFSLAITGQFNLVTVDALVHGVRCEDLEPSDLPGEGEPLGTMLTKPEDIAAYVEAHRPLASGGNRVN